MSENPIFPNEPVIAVNGVLLSPGQAMTLRVALQCFFTEIGEKDSLGADEVGRALRMNYLERGVEINHLMRMTGEPGPC